MSIHKVNGLFILDVPTGCGISFHSFYLKEHHENKAQPNTSKTLFVGNVDFHENASFDDISNFLTALFSTFGSIESISVSDFNHQENVNSKNSRFAHVVFKSKSSIKAILSPSSQKIFSDIKKNIVNQNVFSNQINSKCYYDFDDSTKLSEEANEYIQNYEESEEIDSINRKKEQQVDEDGFTQVTYRNSKKRKASTDEDSKINRNNKSRSRSKKKTIELTNFYRFQMRVEKQNKLEELRHKFERDREKVAIMKSRRKFKPF